MNNDRLSSKVLEDGSLKVTLNYKRTADVQSVFTFYTDGTFLDDSKKEYWSIIDGAVHWSDTSAKKENRWYNFFGDKFLKETLVSMIVKWQFERQVL